MANDVWQYNGVEFRAGDTVKVVRIEEDFAPNGMGEGIVWENTWADYFNMRGTLEGGMSAYIGLTYEIDSIDETGVHFVEDEQHSNFYAYPLSVLENISARVKEAA